MMADVEDYLMPGPTSFHNAVDEVVHDWTKKMECKTLSPQDFKYFWGKNVPVIYSPQPECDCLNIEYNEELAQQVLFLPMEQFIAGSREPESAFEQLKTLDNLPSLCGKIFKSGEPTYSCRDCGLDPTCVLCVSCFKNSAHRHHKYKMSTSGGGGYCDCGDEEAWKTNCFCETHHKGKSQASNANPLDKLTTDLVERLKFVMQVVLHYCHQLLTWDQPINLPAGLDVDASKKVEFSDAYATVLFNDETHTYEQVIEVLVKAINCSKKSAVDYATMIDREGRSIIKCSTFTQCNQVRHVIERITMRYVTNRLKVTVLHTDVLSHQTFAMKLLSWLQKILVYSEGFRIVFGQVMMEPYESEILLESVMLNDTQLWKTARNQWHQLFISGMLMDQHCKKVFAKAFTKNYPTVLKDFIADDHDHSISVTSLSVQIFTVPTLAHMLIQEDDAITVLLRAFLAECERNKNEEGKLAFQRNQANNSFRRAQYMLYDLKYLLTVIPSEWNDQLRKNFLRGLQSYLTLLNMMQGMDLVVRQVGQHVEFEAEWESGVNLQIKISSLCSLMLTWCGSDKVVFIKAFRTVLKLLKNSQSRIMCVGIELANHSASCIEYDVSSMPVTIHLPLSRFAAGLFLSLEKFSLYYEGPQFQLDSSERPSPEQLMELPLRTLVMLAQFRAGMWRRNGYSLLNQVYFYHNVKLRDEMYDRDIMMLQIAASMIESNEFLIHLIYKYGLLNWADEAYLGTPHKSEDDLTRQVKIVAEEFLYLILIIVSERFTPGIGNVTEEEKIKKEIIQLLCIEPMPHSQLYKMLPKDLNSEALMDNIVNEVASFRKPHGPGTGKYELKPEYLKYFNPFYYHYNREEQSRAEEDQLKRKKQACDEMCCPPPVLPEFSPRFSMVINILQCDVMIHVLHLVFARTLNLQCAAFSEAQFEKALHIAGVALHEEERALIGDGENAFFCFTTKALRKGILDLMEECLKSPRIETHKDLLRWVINKFRHVESLRTKDKDERSTFSTSSDAQSGESSVESRKQKADEAAARRARIMAQMSAMQKSFIKEHAELFKEAVLEDSANLSKVHTTVDLYSEDSVCIGNEQSGRSINFRLYTCILCKEDQDVTSSGRALVLAAFIQKSTVLSKNRKHYLTDPESYDPMLFPSDLFCAPHSSTCGHVMHSDCWGKYFESVVQKEQRRPARFGRHTSFEVDKNEYLCPLCERLSNSVIPIIPPLATLIPERHLSPVNLSIDDWLSIIKIAAENCHTEKLQEPASDEDKAKQLAYHYLPLPLSELAKTVPEAHSEQFLALFSRFQSDEAQEQKFSESLIEMMKLFSQATYTVGLNSDPNTSDIRVPAVAWWSCAYTIHAIEWLLREQNKSLFGTLPSRNALCLEAIVRFSGASLLIFDHDVVRTQCVRLLRYLLLGEHYLSSPQCCLDFDAFTVLVFLTLSMPVLFKHDKERQYQILHPQGSLLDRHIVHLIFTFHLVQLLLTYEFHEEESMDVDAVSDETEGSEDLVAAHFYQELRTAAGLSQDKAVPSSYSVVKCIKSNSLPFLRCVAVFYQTLTDIPAPVDLQDLSEMEFEHLCKYLGLPTTINELLLSPSLTQLALSWARHPRMPHLLLLSASEESAALTSDSPNEYVECLVRHPLTVNHLVPLPSDYSELINSVSLFTCPNSDGDDSKNPTMCLVCGTVLCSQSYCCQTDFDGSLVGACTTHAYYCGAGVGIYLRIRDCKILLLFDRSKGCFVQPPYVDEYGETDQGLFRGNPLHLCNEKYTELNELWLSHNIPERISHTMEQSTSVPNWLLL